MPRNILRLTSTTLTGSQILNFPSSESMKTIKTTIRISASPQTVSSVMDNLARYPEWNQLPADLSGRTTVDSVLRGTLTKPKTPPIPSVNRILVRGESVHQLERIIHAGPIRVDRGRRRDEKVMISGALTLLTNAVIAYNTFKLHRVLERSREAGQPVPSDEILAHVAPIAFRHINFQGIYRFPLKRYLTGFYRQYVFKRPPGRNELSTGCGWAMPRRSSGCESRSGSR
jgi:hypothetical protein